MDPQVILPFAFPLAGVLVLGVATSRWVRRFRAYRANPDVARDHETGSQALNLAGLVASALQCSWLGPLVASATPAVVMWVVTTLSLPSWVVEFSPFALVGAVVLGAYVLASRGLRVLARAKNVCWPRLWHFPLALFLPVAVAGLWPSAQNTVDMALATFQPPAAAAEAATEAPAEEAPAPEAPAAEAAVPAGDDAAAAAPAEPAAPAPAAAEPAPAPEPAGPVGDIPAEYLALYQQAGTTCPQLDWGLLAGVGKVETDHGRARLPGVTSGTNHKGAAGPMQFLRPTWDEVRGKHPEVGPDIYNPHHAIPAAAHYLCDSGLTKGRGVRAALFRYNRSVPYADRVLAHAERYRAEAAR
jgi:hypothetical protein